MELIAMCILYCKQLICSLSITKHIVFSTFELLNAK